MTIVDIRSDPIVAITENGVNTQNAFYKIDMLVVATGYDAATGPLLAMDISGKGGARLKDAWADGQPCGVDVLAHVLGSVNTPFIARAFPKAFGNGDEPGDVAARATGDFEIRYPRGASVNGSGDQ